MRLRRVYLNSYTLPCQHYKIARISQILGGFVRWGSPIASVCLLHSRVFRMEKFRGAPASNSHYGFLCTLWYLISNQDIALSIITFMSRSSCWIGCINRHPLCFLSTTSLPSLRFTIRDLSRWHPRASLLVPMTTSHETRISPSKKEVGGLTAFYLPESGRQ